MAFVKKRKAPGERARPKAEDVKARREVAGFSKVSSKGQITISAGLRKAIGLRPGDDVVLIRQHDGTLKVERLMSREELLALLPLARVPPIDWKAVREEIAEELAERAFKAIDEANAHGKDALP